MEHLIEIPTISYFLLIQNNKILNVENSPVLLSYSLADKQADIIVAAGIVNEFGKREIIGICGHYIYVPFASAWAVITDGTEAIYTKVTGKPGELLRDCLYELRKKGRLSDPVNFSTITIAGER